MSDDIDAAQVVRAKADATDRLLAIPGVTMVAVGGKETGGRPTGELVIKVFVRDKRPAAEVPADQLIPPLIDGIRTDVVAGGGTIVPLAELPADGVFVRDEKLDDKAYRRPLIGGGQLTPWASQSHGTLGCLLWAKNNHNVGYALTNHHVVDGPDIRPLKVGVTKVGQPSGTKHCGCCDDVIGVYAGGGQADDDRDEAVVKLAPGTRFQGKIEGIGLIKGPHDIAPDEIKNLTYEVRKRGVRTKLTGGVVVAINGTTSTADNQIVIKPKLPKTPSPTESVFFADHGDSGSALVNAAGEVVGLVFAAELCGEPHPPETRREVFAFAYPIKKVLERFKANENLDLEVATAANEDDEHTTLTTATVAAPPELAGQLGATPGEQARVPVGRAWFAEVPPPDAAVGGLLADLERSDAGRRLLALWERHREELANLVAHNRRVTIVWHRRGGAALFQLMLRMLARHDVALPHTLYGEPLATCVDRLYETFARYASGRLRADLARAHAALPDLAGLTYPQLIDALEARGGHG